MNELTVKNQNSKLVSNLLSNIGAYAEDTIITGSVKNTWQSYRTDARCLNEFYMLLEGVEFVLINEGIKTFLLYVDDGGEIISMSPRMLMAYITYLADQKPVYKNTHFVGCGMSYASILHRVAFISSLHKKNNAPSPYTSAIEEYLKRLRKKMGREGKKIHSKQAQKANVFDIKEAVDKVLIAENEKITELKGRKTKPSMLEIRIKKARLTSLRDRLILLIGFNSMCRIEELSALYFEQLEFSSNAVFIHMTDQDNKTGSDYKKHLPKASNPLYCPVFTLRQYLQETKTTKGHLFWSINNKGLNKSGKHLNKRSVLRIIHKYLGTNKSGHSLRIGMAVAMYEADVPIKVIMNNGGWKSEVMLWRYLKQYDVAKYNKSVM